MAKTSLVKDELVKGQKILEKESYVPDIVESVTKLLEYDDQKDRQMLKHLGIDTQIQIASDMRNKKLTLENLNSKFKGDIFHIDVIKNLCINYRLRFLRSNNYRGGVDLKLPTIIRDYSQEIGEDLTNPGLLSTRFFIMAPPEAFQLEKVIVPKQLKNPDPVLFYQVDDDHYRMIHKWGSDFSIFRAISGYRWKSEGNYIWFGFLVSLAISFLAVSVIFPVSAVGGCLYYACGFLGSVIGAFFHYNKNGNGSRFFQENLTSDNWNSSQYTTKS